MMMKYLKNLKFWVIFTISLYTFIGFIGIPWFLVNKAPSIANEKIGLNLDIKKASFNPYSFELTLEDILIKDLDLKPALELKKIYVNYNSLWLLEKTFYFSQLEIDSPKFYTTIEKDGKINLENIILTNTKQEETTESSSSSIEFILQKFNIKNGQLAFTDLRGKKPFNLNFGPYNFKAHDISTKRGDFNAHSFKTIIKSGGELFWKGGMSLKPFKLYGQINITNLKLPKLYSYIMPKLGASLQKGELSLRIPYQVDLTKELEVNINDAQLILSDVQISHKKNGDEIINIPELKVSDFNLAWPKQDIKIGNISLNSPSILAILEKNGDINLANAFASKEKKENNQTVTNDAKPWSYLLKSADISFVDSTFKTPFKSKLRTTSLHVKNISSDLTSPITYDFSTILNKDTQIKALGDVTQESKTVNSSLKLSSLHVKEFIKYIEPFITFKLINADVDTDAKINLDYGEDFNLKLRASTFINSLAINSKSDEKLIKWEKFGVSGVDFDLKKQDISIANINLDNADIYTVLNKKGDINLIQAFEAKKQDTKQKNKKDKNAKPWTFLLKDAKINQTNVSFTDKTLAKPLQSNLKNISLHVKNISSSKNVPITYNLTSTINKDTKLKASGDMIQKTNILNSNVKLSQLHINDFIGYIEPFINFKINSASVNTSAKIRLDLSKKLNINVKADTSINNLFINGSDGKNLINWKNLDIKGIKYTHLPMDISIKKLTLKEPNIRTAIAKDRSTNFSNLIKEDKNIEPKKKQKDVKKTSPLKLKIGPIKLINGTTEFSDLSLPFPFKTIIHDLNGEISTLNFAETTPSLIGLTGKIDKYGYADIKGKLIPIDIEENSNINVLLKNIDLSSLTPYSGKFVGYKIKSGKLSMDLKYNINKASLQGDNKINIDTLTLGETIDSPEATNLPLELAIALLKDSNNQINIDLPVSGDMNSPDFSYGSVVWGAIGNMITGIVTAPFKFLGSMLGVDGDELKSIDFDQGSSVIISTEHEKLKNLQKILAKRPNIKIKITGGYDEVYDVKELQKQDFIMTVKKELAKVKTNKKDKKTDNYGLVLKDLYTKNFTAPKYEELKKSFMLIEKSDDNKTKANKKQKPKLDVLAFNEKMQNELISSIKIEDKRLITLADNRAKRVSEELNKTYKIDASRVSILPSISKTAKRDRWIVADIEISI